MQFAKLVKEYYDATVRARPGHVNTLSVSHSESGFYGTFLWARKKRNVFPARAGRPDALQPDRARARLLHEEACPAACAPQGPRASLGQALHVAAVDARAAAGHGRAQAADPARDAGREGEVVSPQRVR